MTLLERGRCALLGRPMAPPPEIGDDVPQGVTLRRGRIVPRLAGILCRMGGPAAAVTLGRTIVVSPGTRLTRSLLAHELIHVRQWRTDPLFPLRYAIATVRHGYRENPYEVEARTARPAPNPAPRTESPT